MILSISVLSKLETIYYWL